MHFVIYSERNQVTFIIRIADAPLIILNFFLFFFVLNYTVQNLKYNIDIYLWAYNSNSTNN